MPRFRVDMTVCLEMEIDAADEDELKLRAKRAYSERSPGYHAKELSCHVHVEDWVEIEEEDPRDAD